jgi:bifunctional ADP-heptose synthase (sugar kinase/adenylyltransferase)
VDTRGKILSEDAALAVARASGPRLKVVSGFFDPLLADHARRLAEIAGWDNTLMVLVTSPPDPILPARARAEMVAALAVVSYVVIGGEWLLARLAGHEVIREEEADRRRTEELIRHVQSRR